MKLSISSNTFTYITSRNAFKITPFPIELIKRLRFGTHLFVSRGPFFRSAKFWLVLLESLLILNAFPHLPYDESRLFSVFQNILFFTLFFSPTTKYRSDCSIYKMTLFPNENKIKTLNRCKINRFELYSLTICFVKILHKFLIHFNSPM